MYIGRLDRCRDAARSRRPTRRCTALARHVARPFTLSIRAVPGRVSRSMPPPLLESVERKYAQGDANTGYATADEVLPARQPFVIWSWYSRFQTISGGDPHRTANYAMTVG